MGNELLTLGGSTVWNMNGDNSWGGAVDLSYGYGFYSTTGTLTLGSTVNGGHAGFICGTGNITVTGAYGEGGAYRLGKLGTGILTLNGDCNYTGETDIYDGTINFNGANVALGHVIAYNGPGTKIAGTGTIPGDVTMNYGSILAPGGANGDDVGTLMIDGVLTFNGASKYVVTMKDGAIDKIVTGSNLVAYADARIEFQDGYDAVDLDLPATIIKVGDTYTALTNALPSGYIIDGALVGDLIRLTAVPTLLTGTITDPTTDQSIEGVVVIINDGSGVTYENCKRFDFKLKENTYDTKIGKESNDIELYSVWCAPNIGIVKEQWVMVKPDGEFVDWHERELIEYTFPEGSNLSDPHEYMPLANGATWDYKLTEYYAGS